jgi:hypothetical protein
MAYIKQKKKKSLPTLLGGLTSFSSVANMVKNLNEPEKFYELEIGEVLDVLLTEEDLLERQPNVENNAESNFGYIGMIKVRLINSEQGKPENDCGWVYPLDSNIKQLPVRGEYVVCMSYMNIRFYTQTLNFLSSISTNAVPGLSSISQKPKIDTSGYAEVDSGETEPTDSEEGGFTLGEFFKRKTYIRQLKPYEGDLTIQGRFGNSIRFGSNISDDSDLDREGTKDEEGDIDSPNIKMRVGQLTDLGQSNKNEDIETFEENKKEEGKFQPYVIEDINADGSSIYLTTNEIIPLNRATDPVVFGDETIHHLGLGGHVVENFVSEHGDSIPKKSPDELSGQQILLCTDRIVFNSKADGLYSYTNTDTYFSSGNFFVVDARKGVSVNTNGVVGFTSEKDFELVTKTKTVITSPEIYLGDTNNSEPVVNGIQLVNFLSNLISTIKLLVYPYTGTLANGVILKVLEDDLAKLEKASFNSEVNFTR